ncbi:MAG: hypothetical protein QF441_15225 [Bacteriovoracaceae bacterium]|nr:hypothetical protein [Bacteriovoracaceae bacterium]
MSVYFIITSYIVNELILKLIGRRPKMIFLVPLSLSAIYFYSFFEVSLFELSDYSLEKFKYIALPLVFYFYLIRSTLINSKERSKSFIILILVFLTNYSWAQLALLSLFFLFTKKQLNLSYLITLFLGLLNFYYTNFALSWESMVQVNSIGLLALLAVNSQTEFKYKEEKYFFALVLGALLGTTSYLSNFGDTTNSNMIILMGAYAFFTLINSKNKYYFLSSLLGVSLTSNIGMYNFITTLMVFLFLELTSSSLETINSKKNILTNPIWVNLKIALLLFFIIISYKSHFVQENLIFVPFVALTLLYLRDIFLITKINRPITDLAQVILLILSCGMVAL